MALCPCPSSAVLVQHRQSVGLEASHSGRPGGEAAGWGADLARRERVVVRWARPRGTGRLVAARRNGKGIARCSAAASSSAPWKVMISGAPASGKGTQCQFIKERFNLVHIAAGDLLRAEVAAGTDAGKEAEKYMNLGQLVPNEIVVTMVKDRLTRPDAVAQGWLLDGYPRSLSQAEALEKLNIRPQLFILLEVPDEVLVERVVGRRMDPVTGKIYHLKFSPPENEEIAARLIQRSDDTEEKVQLRLQTHHQNLAAVLSVYEGVIKRVDGNRPKPEVFAEIINLLSEVQEKNVENRISGARKMLAALDLQAQPDINNVPNLPQLEKSWRGIPTKLNSIPHSREIRAYFYKDVCEATKRAVEDGLHKLRVQLTIPELNPEMDVYRIGTLLELIRELAFTFANDGKRVRVCVQGSMGEGIFAGMPLQLAGTRRMLEAMDWGEYGAKGEFINIGSVGAKEVTDQDDMFILMAPQNATGNCIIDDLQAMVNAAGERPVIILNPRLKDLPGAGGVMQVRGRQERMDFVASFFTCYNFRLLYLSGTQYPILGALRMAYPQSYEVYRRLDTEQGRETYALLGTFPEEPSGSEIGDAFEGRTRTKDTPTGFWGLLRSIF